MNYLCNGMMAYCYVMVLPEPRQRLNTRAPGEFREQPSFRKPSESGQTCSVPPRPEAPLPRVRPACSPVAKRNARRVPLSWRPSTGQKPTPVAWELCLGRGRRAYRTYVRTYVRTCIYWHTYTHIYIYIYIHTHVR